MKVRIDIVSLYVGDTAASLMRASILDASGAVVATADASDATAELDNVAAGSYTAQAQRIAADGSTLGDLLSYPFSAIAGSAAVTHYGAGINVAISE